jgi:hypothetical protein
MQSPITSGRKLAPNGGSCNPGIAGAGVTWGRQDGLRNLARGWREYSAAGGKLSCCQFERARFDSMRGSASRGSSAPAATLGRCEPGLESQAIPFPSTAPRQTPGASRAGCGRVWTASARLWWLRIGGWQIQLRVLPPLQARTISDSGLERRAGGSMREMCRRILRLLRARSASSPSKSCGAESINASGAGKEESR